MSLWRGLVLTVLGTLALALGLGFMVAELGLLAKGPGRYPGGAETLAQGVQFAPPQRPADPLTPGVVPAPFSTNHGSEPAPAPGLAKAAAHEPASARNRGAEPLRPIDVAPPPQRRALSWNLGPVSYWSTQVPFLDVIRQAQPWVGHLPGRWGGWGEAELAEAGALDEDGWIRFVPPELTHISTMVLAEIPPEATSLAGFWVARWEGTGQIRFRGGIRNLRQGQNEARFEFVPGTGAILIDIFRGPIRNLTLVQEVHRAAFATGAVFRPDFLAKIGDAAQLRFMDWMQTNNSTLAHWEDRPQLTDYSWERRGVPLEIMLRLANETGAEPWFTLPHLADDDFVRRFAEMVKSALDPALRVWVEYSNEVWNFSFAQAAWAEQAARARWGRQWAWTQFYAVRAAEVMAIWSEVFADEPNRLVRVIATQTGWLGLEEDMLEAPLFLAEDPSHVPPWQSFDAYAVTGYFNAELNGEDRQPMLSRWLAESREAAEAEAHRQGLTGRAFEAFVATHRFDRAIARAGEELLDGRHSGRPQGSVRHLLEVVLPYHAEAAARRGLALVMYEGGTHVVATPAQHAETELVAFFTALNYSEAIADAYRALIAGWRRLTPAPFNHYVLIGAPTVWGAWGALRHLDDDNPRWRALIAATEPAQQALPGQVEP